jgi:hypothetical protein
MAIAKNYARGIVKGKFNQLNLFHFYHCKYIYDDNFAPKKAFLFL